MSRVKQYYFIRHGETDFNKQGIIQGRGVDTNLNATGQLQAALFYEKYKHLDFDLVITSSMQRSYETISPFLEHNYPVERFPELDEIHWGKFEGVPASPELHQRYLEIVNAWSSGDLDHKVPGGESARDLSDRLARFLALLDTRDEQLTLVCTHGRTLRCLMCLISGRPIQDMESFGHANTCLYLVTARDGKYTIEKENDISHLDSKFPAS